MSTDKNRPNPFPFPTPMSFFRDRRTPKPWEISPELDPRYMVRIGPNGENKLTDLRADYGSRKNIKLTSPALGMLGDVLTREFDSRTGAEFYGGGEQARVPVPRDSGTPFKPDDVVGKNQHVFLNENKFNKAVWRARQLLGYERYSAGNLRLDTSKSPRLAAGISDALQRGSLNSDVVAGVRVFRWNSEIAPTSQLLRGAAANFEQHIGPLQDARGRTRKSASQAKLWLDGKVAELDGQGGRAAANPATPNRSGNPKFGPGTPHRDQLGGRSARSLSGKITGGVSSAARSVVSAPARLGTAVGSKISSNAARLGTGTGSGMAKGLSTVGAKVADSSIGKAASKVANSTAGKIGGKLLGPAATAFAINSDIKKGDSVAKAVTKNGIGLGASIAAGAAVGTMIPVPVVGTVAGAAVGAAVGLGATKVVDKAWQPAAKGVGKAKKWLASKFATGGPVIGGLPSIDEAVASFVSRSGVNPAMSSVLEKAAGGLGDAAKAFVSGQSEDVGKTFGLRNGLPAVARAGAQTADLLRSGLDPSAVKASAQQSGSHAWSAAKQAIPAKALGAVNSGGDSVDQSMTINLQTPDVDTAFQKSKTWESQRALTYAGTW
ncbi:hypothetical protein [Nocardia asteroides]